MDISNYMVGSELNELPVFPPSIPIEFNSGATYNWKNYHYPTFFWKDYYKDYYPVEYTKDQSRDKEKKAYEIIKILKNKNLVEIKTADNFMNLMDELIKIL